MTDWLEHFERYLLLDSIGELNRTNCVSVKAVAPLGTEEQVTGDPGGRVGLFTKGVLLDRQLIEDGDDVLSGLLCEIKEIKEVFLIDHVIITLKVQKSFIRARQTPSLVYGENVAKVLLLLVDCYVVSDHLDLLQEDCVDGDTVLSSVVVDLNVDVITDYVVLGGKDCFLVNFVLFVLGVHMVITLSVVNHLHNPRFPLDFNYSNFVVTLMLDRVVHSADV